MKIIYRARILVLVRWFSIMTYGLFKTTSLDIKPAKKFFYRTHLSACTVTK